MNNAARFPARFTFAQLSYTLLLAVALAASSVQAMDNPRVDDKAGFFSTGAVNKANDMIAQIKRDRGKDFYVDTIPTIPDELKSQYRPDQRAQFFLRLADERAKAAKVDGVIVLISRDPAYVQVRVGKNTIQQAFIQRDADQLQSILTSSFKSKEFDQGLLSGVEHVRATFAQSMPRGSGSAAGPAAAPAPVDRGSDSSRTLPGGNSGGGAPVRTSNPLGGMTSWICIGGAVLLVFILFRVMRSRSAQSMPGQQGRYGAPGDPNAPYGQQGGYQQAPGSGMGRGLLGGLLGGALGGYAYDRFMRRPGDTGAHGDSGAAGG
ncbi:MAG: TPM domain-containing protein, partial [Anaerolineae bacterium]|nr:TPM domain-containing protein [Phycisphaerae bacterium]